jgi:hypothetical protein
MQPHGGRVALGEGVDRLLNKPLPLKRSSRNGKLVPQLAGIASERRRKLGERPIALAELLQQLVDDVVGKLKTRLPSASEAAKQHAAQWVAPRKPKPHHDAGPTRRGRSIVGPAL